MTMEEHEAYSAGLEDGEGGHKSPQLPDETDAVYACYLQGFREGQNQARYDAENDPGSWEFWD